MSFLFSQKIFDTWSNIFILGHWNLDNDSRNQLNLLLEELYETEGDAEKLTFIHYSISHTFETEANVQISKFG